MTRRTGRSLTDSSLWAAFFGSAPHDGARIDVQEDRRRPRIDAGPRIEDGCVPNGNPACGREERGLSHDWLKSVSFPGRRLG